MGYCHSRDDPVREGAREQQRYCSTSGVPGFEGDEMRLSPLLSSGQHLPPLAPDICSTSEIPEPKTRRQEEVTSS